MIAPSDHAPYRMGGKAAEELIVRRAPGVLKDEMAISDCPGRRLAILPGLTAGESDLE